VLELAQILMQTQHADAAVQLLEEAKQRLPKNLELREALVQVHIEQADYQAADAAAAEVTNAFVADWRGPYLQSQVAQARKRPEDASRDLERALALKPDAMTPLSAISRLDVAAGRKAQAVARVRAQVTGHPQDAVLHNLLGEVLVQAGNPAQAAPEFSRALQLQPLWWRPYHNLGSVQLSLSGVDTALATYKQGVVATREEPELVIDLASTYEQADRSAEAIKAYENFCRGFPGITITANTLAMLLVTHNKDAASLQRARELTARFMTSTTPELLDTAGWVRLKSGDVTAALPVLEEAVQRAPDSRVMRYHLGMAQLQAGQRQQARASLEAALTGAVSFEGSAEARSALASLGPAHHS
jgi:Flp pilus assembly protein TadD